MLNKDRGLREWYEDLAGERAPYLTRAEEASKLTVPWFMPTEGTGNATLYRPHQSVGAEGVTNLASRLTTVHMPPNKPFFRFRIARAVLDEATKEDKKMLPEIEAALARVEREVLANIETYGDRAACYIANMHLIVAGNVLMRVDSDTTKVYPLRSYVVQRDPDDNILVIIVREEIAHDALPDKLRKLIKAQTLEASIDTYNGIDHTTVHEIYTCIKRTPTKWIEYQECEGIRVGKEGSYPLDLCPWIPQRMFRSGQESYGRGYVEMYLGDLNSCEVLTKALNDTSAAAAKVIFLVHPSAYTKVDDLVRADNLSFVAGKKDDIDTLQLEKYNDLQVAEKRVRELEQKLARVFLLHSAVRRDAERVTAEEIRYMAQELESMLGGLYSLLAKEWQKPYVNLRLHYLQEEGKLDKLPDVELEIVTGVEALGRGQEASALVEFLTVIGRIPGAEQLMRFFNIGGMLRTLAAAFGIDDSALLKTDEEQAAESQTEQMNALMQNVAPNMVNAGAQLLGNAQQQDAGNLPAN